MMNLQVSLVNRELEKRGRIAIRKMGRSGKAGECRDGCVRHRGDGGDDGGGDGSGDGGDGAAIG